jgi:ribonuclease P protein component
LSRVRRRSRDGADGSSASFPRAARIRKTSDYRRTQSSGRRIRRPRFVVIVAKNGTADSRFGLTVSRKVGGAVVRNRVKRWLREAVRHERSSAPGGWDVVIVAQPDAATAGAAVLRSDLRSVLDDAGVFRR